MPRIRFKFNFNIFRSVGWDEKRKTLDIERFFFFFSVFRLKQQTRRLPDKFGLAHNNRVCHSGAEAITGYICFASFRRGWGRQKPSLTSNTHCAWKCESSCALSITSEENTRSGTPKWSPNSKNWWVVSEIQWNPRPRTTSDRVSAGSARVEIGRRAFETDRKTFSIGFHRFFKAVL